MQRPLTVPIGAPPTELDTPALVVDLAIFERNLALAHGAVARRGVTLRPDAHTHKTPALAHRQLAVAGSAPGVAVVSVGEAEVFVEAGISDVLISQPVVSTSKIQRMCALARRARIAVAVDDARILAAVSEAAALLGVRLDVLIVVQSHPAGAGVSPGTAVLDLARAASGRPGVHFAGLMTTVSRAGGDATDALRVRAVDAARALAATRAALERGGVAVGVCSVGDATDTYDVVAAVEGITEVRCGAYALQDGLHLPHRPDPQVELAARVLTTVNSRPEPGRAIIDCGQKAIARDPLLAHVANDPDHVVVGLSAEHGYVERRDGGPLQFAIGDQVWLAPGDVSGAFAVHDVVYGIRRGRVEAVWSVAARGRFA